MKVDNIIDGIMTHGRGTLSAKFGVQSAYRIIPVHSHDRYLLGIKWRGEYFIDLSLPFGLSSAPFMFSSFTDLLEWIVKHNYEVQFLLHYFNDFHTLGPPDSPVCQQNLDTCVLQCGIPLHPDKLEGPSMCLTVLGIELYSLTLRARLSQEKFDHIAALLDTWSSKQMVWPHPFDRFMPLPSVNFWNFATRTYLSVRVGLPCRLMHPSKYILFYQQFPLTL